VARLVALEAAQPNLVFGLLEGKLNPIPDDFDAPLSDDLPDAFEGR
jgi:hypothetical protein